MVPGIGGFGGLFPLGITNFIHLQLIIAYEYASVGGVILEVFYIFIYFFPTREYTKAFNNTTAHNKSIQRFKRRKTMIFVICACCQIIFSGYSHLLTPFESYFHCLFTDFWCSFL